MVAILLSTYNGEKYLSQQIDSIINQTFKEWKLFIRDDGSTDGTREIIKKYTNSYNNIFFFDDDGLNLKSAKSFLKLLQNVESPYYMFCDQDDVWLPRKIEIMIKEIQVLEDYNQDCPILIHSDLYVVDSNLKVISDSFWNYSSIDPYVILEKYIRVTNSVTGCATFFNSLARSEALNVPDNLDIIMHDYWLPITVLSKNGLVKPIEYKTVYYRQHERNVIGAGKGTIDSIWTKLIKFKSNISYNVSLFNMVNSKIKTNILTYIILKVQLYIIRKYKRK